jgi:hypothetical protein
MPQRNPLIRAARRRLSRWDEWDQPPSEDAAPAGKTRRVMTTTTFAVAFAFGAALSAGAGDTVATMVEGTPTAAVPVASLPPEDVAPAAEPAATTALPETGADQAATATAPATTPALEAAHPLAEPEVVEELAPTTQPPAAQTAEPPAGVTAAVEPAPTIVVSEPKRARPKPKRKAAAKVKARWRARPEPLLRPRPRPRSLGSELEPEAALPGVDATVWLHRSLPDPTPPSKRLTRAFAHNLRSVARASGVDWALMLGLLRSEGKTGAAPAAPPELRALASRLDYLRHQDERSIALALARDSERADRALALAHYHRAVGLRALVRGLEWAKPRLEARLLRDDRIATYEGGRLDIESSRVDVRVLVLIAYLADTYGDVTVSSLKAGHRLYSRPGVISAHVYGLAVDIAALGGRSIAGNQEPGGLTEEAVRNILLLPAELQPRQVISLIGLGGPSFPMGDHGDHIHVGY